jgi:hypothetical protein
MAIPSVHPPPARIAASYWEIKELSHVESRRDTPVTERGRHCRRRCSASVLRSVARARHEATPQSPALKTRKPGRSHSAGGPRSTAESPRTELISGRGGRPADGGNTERIHRLAFRRRCRSFNTRGVPLGHCGPGSPQVALGPGQTKTRIHRMTSDFRDAHADSDIVHQRLILDRARSIRRVNQKTGLRAFHPLPSMWWLDRLPRFSAGFRARRSYAASSMGPTATPQRMNPDFAAGR